MSEGAWLALAAFWPSLAVAFAGYRSTRVSVYKDRIELLEEESEACKEQVRRLREDNEWLMEQARRWTGQRRPRWSPDDRPDKG